MNSDVHMHHIQKSIILSLARTSPLRFTDLQPPRIPNNTFSYHLKKLVDSGYIELVSEGYIPTRKALKIVVFGASTGKATAKPETITIVYVENPEGEILLLNRNHQPFKGWYGLPAGQVHLGETLEQAAQRELAEKTTLSPHTALRAVGVLDFRYIEQGTRDIFMHMIGFVYKYRFTGDRQELSDKATRYGQLSWSRLDHDFLLPEVYVIKKLVESKAFTYLSVSFEEPVHVPTLSVAFSDTTQEMQAYPPIITGLSSNT
jgi:ADP-ribose pyrophosphatase YjhB (NUDIX family)